jgi:hypothetical protein
MLDSFGMQQGGTEYRRLVAAFGSARITSEILVPKPLFESSAKL